MVNLVKCLDKVIDYRGKTPMKSDHGIITLSAKSIKNNEILYDKAYYVSEETYTRFMVRGFPRKGDILLTTEAPLGCVCELDQDGLCVAQRVITLRANSDILDNKFLKYYLQSPEGQYSLKSRATGTTVQGIKRSEFRKIEFLKPSLPEQRAIGTILGALDDKIDLLRRQNATLEAMA